jgi:hypothetical protein
MAVTGEVVCHGVFENNLPDRANTAGIPRRTARLVVTCNAPPWASAPALFDLALDAARAQTVSGKGARRALLGRALLKRCLGATSLVTTKRKPFDVLAKGPFLGKTRGDWI